MAHRFAVPQHIPRRWTSPSRVPRCLLVSNPGVRARLAVDVVSLTQVIARLAFTNVTDQTQWLYKPLTGDGHWERIFQVLMESTQAPLSYEGPHTEEYVDGHTQSLIIVHPRPEESWFIKLAPDATYSTEKNLCDVYAFPAGPNNYLIRYSAVMPLMESGVHLQRPEPKHQQIRPVYYNIASSLDLTDAGKYVAFSIDFER